MSYIIVNEATQEVVSRYPEEKYGYEETKKQAQKLTQQTHLYHSVSEACEQCHSQPAKYERCNNPRGKNVRLCRNCFNLSFGNIFGEWQH